MTALNVTLPPALESALTARVAEAGYVDADEYVRDLLRRDLAQSRDNRRWLRAMIDDGLASGLVDGEADDVLDRIIAEDAELRA